LKSEKNEGDAVPLLASQKEFVAMTVTAGESVRKALG
jgi:hypothetical protein